MPILYVSLRLCTSEHCHFYPFFWTKLARAGIRHEQVFASQTIKSCLDMRSSVAFAACSGIIVSLKSKSSLKSFLFRSNYVNWISLEKQPKKNPVEVFLAEETSPSTWLTETIYRLLPSHSCLTDWDRLSSGCWQLFCMHNLKHLVQL